MQTVRNYIDGQFVAPAPDDQTMPTVCPATGEPIAMLPIASSATVDAAVAAASRAFRG